jgi:hypothetical protein
VQLSSDTIVALGSTLLAIVSAIVSSVGATRAARQAQELERELRRESAAEAAKRILNQYRDPLLDAAQTLQSRLGNIVKGQYLVKYLHCGDPVEERYARDFTVYAVAEYLCWAEIVRRELRFLDDGGNEGNTRLLALLAQAQVSFQADRIPLPLRAFRGQQRAIAEIMMIPTNAPEGPRSEAMGYAAFCKKLDTDADFAAWFQRMRFEDIPTIAEHGEAVNTRLAILSHDMIDLIDFLDPNAVRIPRQLRRRVSEKRPGPELTIVI